MNQGIWDKYLCNKRLEHLQNYAGLHGDSSESKQFDSKLCRSSFQKDWDRVVFSSAIKRLKNKTQVHRDEGDHITTRLSHSLEVSSIARSLGYGVAKNLGLSDELANKIGQVLQVAGLLHDVGHPPFGHAGESIMKKYFEEFFKVNEHNLSEYEQKDFLYFDSNALSFEIGLYGQALGIGPMPDLDISLDNCAQQVDFYNRSENGDLYCNGVTFATLATLAKYPNSSNSMEYGSDKYSIFRSNLKEFALVAEHCGLKKLREEESCEIWCKHPLTYLLEAADDICYTIIDQEDAIRMGVMGYESFLEIAKELGIETGKISHLSPDEARVFLRGKMINVLMGHVIEMFCANADAILSQEFGGNNLFDLAEAQKAPIVQELKACNAKIYSDANQIHDDAGKVYLHKLIEIQLDKFSIAHTANGVHTQEPYNKDRGVNLLNLTRGVEPDEQESHDYKKAEYKNLLGVLKYVSCTTEDYVKNVVEKLC